MSDFWAKNTNQPTKPWEQPIHAAATQEMVLDEQAVAEIQGEQFDVYQDEDDDTAEVMSDVNLRLEQGRLYQLVLQGDIFGETDADPRAIRNVQREIRKFVRERMETMVGIRQEAAAPQVQMVRSDFNELEVQALKMLASKVSGGKTEQYQEEEQEQVTTPKKDGITSINGNLRSQPKPVGRPLPKAAKQPIQRNPAPQRTQAPKQQAKSAINPNEDDGNLTKPIDKMTPEELAAHDAAAAERAARKRSDMPTNMVPHPSGAALEMLYATQAANMLQPGSAINKIMTLMNTPR